MLLLTRLNGHPMAINGDLIKSIESSPDTMITLITGEKIVVRETLEQVLEAARVWRVDLLRNALIEGSSAVERAQQAAASDSATSANVAHRTISEQPHKDDK